MGIGDQSFHLNVYITDQMQKQAVVFDYRSPAFDFGTQMYRKWVPSVSINLKNESNISLAAFNTTNICSVKSAEVSELLLRIPF